MLAGIFSPPKFLPSLSKFFQWKFNAWLIKLLPFAISRRYLIILGWLYYLCKPGEKALISDCLARVTRGWLSPREQRRITKQTFRGIFDHYHEKLFVAYTRLARTLKFLRERVQTDNEACLREALAAGKGVLLVTAHFGAVELLPGALAQKGYPVSMICRFQTSRLRDTLVEKAKAVNLNIIDADAGNILYGALKALKNGHILITECDEFDEWRLTDQKEIRFLGAKLGLDRTLDLLQKRSGAPVVSVLCHRHGKQQYSLQFTPVVDPARAASRNNVAAEALHILEAATQTAPAQWYQWKKFGQMMKPQWQEADTAYPDDAWLAPGLAA
jgi:lauroyl/myristoyl acyltransferase